MLLFQIEKIEFAPFTIIAEDFDHAAQIFIHSLIDGLTNRPNVRFEVAKWIPKPGRENEPPVQWANEGKAGVLWQVDRDEFGSAWELIHSDIEPGWDE